jgi:hypothetical protein
MLNITQLIEGVFGLSVTHPGAVDVGLGTAAHCGYPLHPEIAGRNACVWFVKYQLYSDCCVHIYIVSFCKATVLLILEYTYHM